MVYQGIDWSIISLGTVLDASLTQSSRHGNSIMISARFPSKLECGCVHACSHKHSLPGKLTEQTKRKTTDWHETPQRIFTSAQQVRTWHSERYEELRSKLHQLLIAFRNSRLCQHLITVSIRFTMWLLIKLNEYLSQSFAALVQKGGILVKTQENTQRHSQFATSIRA